MQITLAKETLSKCIGDVATIREKILPKNGKRRQRMNHFLQFILQEDHNVIEFEKMLRNNGLEELLKVDETVQGEHIATQDIGKTISDSSNFMNVLKSKFLLHLILHWLPDCRVDSYRRPDTIVRGSLV